MYGNCNELTRLHGEICGEKEEIRLSEVPKKLKNLVKKCGQARYLQMIQVLSMLLCKLHGEVFQFFRHSKRPYICLRFVFLVLRIIAKVMEILMLKSIEVFAHGATQYF